MEKARFIVTELPRTCRRNMEITCYGEHFTYCFWSGSRKNKLVFEENEQNKIIVTTIRQTWLEFLKDAVSSNLTAFVGVFLHIVGDINSYVNGLLPVYQPIKEVLELARNNLPNI